MNAPTYTVFQNAQMTNKLQYKPARKLTFAVAGGDGAGQSGEGGGGGGEEGGGLHGCCWSLVCFCVLGVLVGIYGDFGGVVFRAPRGMTLLLAV